MIEENYHEVIKAIKTLADKFRDKKQIDKDVISAIWGICHLTRSWAIEQDGMLQQNNLIQKEQVEKLENWIENISYVTFLILNGCYNETAFEFYKNE